MDSKADIIFPSDIRLKSSENTEDLKKYFQNSDKHYEIFYNSSKSSRGVAILISRDVDFEIDRIDRDPTENVLNLKCSKQNVFFNLTSIYGPNEDNMAFFNNIDNILTRNDVSFSIMGGD